MNIDWNHFTPLSALSGGIILGVASALFILMNGRVLGISGILGGLLRPARGDIIWRVLFLAGLFSAPWLFNIIATAELITPPLIDADTALLVFAGLLVGVGTRYGSGCTSGHGVCGLSRLSPRSLVATIAFMAAGFVTVYVVRHFI